MGKRKGLGKGLGALLSDQSIQNIIKSEDKSKVEYIKLKDIVANKDQPRRDFSEESLKGLSESINKYGVIQPIILRNKDDKYEIVAGERRYRASLLSKLEEIPAIIMDIDDYNVDKISLIENIQREDLTVEEEAYAYKKLIEEYNLTQAQLAEEVSKSRSYIANTLRLLNLDQEILDLIQEGKLTRGHGRALLSFDKKDRMAIVREILEKGLSVREVEGKKTRKQNIKPVSKKLEEDIFVRDLEEKLVEKFNTRVKIFNKSDKGRIEIQYYSLDELDSIIQELLD